MKILKFVILPIAVSMLCAGCNKNNIPETTWVNVRMTDAPGNYQKVNVEITGIEFTMNNNSTENLDVFEGIYNLLDLANGMDTVIATDEVTSGKLSQLRLILGTSNTVTIDGVVYPLASPSDLQSGLTLTMNTALTPGVDYNLLLDFDANQSIVLADNGEYQLKPVIKVIYIQTSGSLHGSIFTSLALPAKVSVTNGTSTYTAVTDAGGHFLVRGLSSGIYSVTITPEPPFLPVSIAQIHVLAGTVTELPAFTFP